ncbi:cation:proton antiporter [bacterium]|nr:cation:proton antiporter [bacterium]
MIQGAVIFAFFVLMISLFLAFWRLVQGPSVPDRVVALDLIAALTIGMIAAYSISSGQSVFLDAAVVMALISFLGTIAFAKYLERRVLK